MHVDDVRFKIAAARRMLYREGCDSGVAGHVSVRAAGADAFWITPFEYFDETTPDRVIKLSFDLEVLDGEFEASPAVRFHAAIYQERPDVGSIIHTHSHYASVVTTTGRPVGMYNEVSTLFHNEQAWYADDGVQPQVEGKRMAAALDGRRVLLMRNHGILVAAPSLEEATVDAMTLEKAAKIHLDAEAAGGTEIPLPQVTQAKSLYEQYYRRNTWAAQLRRLRVSDPELFTWLDDGAEPAA